MANEARSSELAITMSYPTRASGIRDAPLEM